MSQLDTAISTFYRRWDALERSRPDGGLVLDFDMAPRVPTPGPYASRREALTELERLREACEGSAELIDESLVSAKLRGSAAYLRALMGERLPFAAYLEATMGVAPRYLSDQALDVLRDESARRFEAHGVPFTAEGRHQLGRIFEGASPALVAQELPGLATLFVERLREMLPDLASPRYTIEFAETDAYWANWIDGTHADGITLKVNTHERIEYEQRSARGLAAHEIAGHAAHVAGMRQAVRDGRLDACALNLTVHSCEAFHMEGLAQVALYALSRPGELDEGDELRLRHRMHSGAVLNQAQIRMEHGMALEEAAAWAHARCPLLNPKNVHASLRDRARSVLYRGYMHVYAPSLAFFLAVRSMSRAGRTAFLREAWSSVSTPSQLRGALEAAGAAG